MSLAVVPSSSDANHSFCNSGVSNNVNGIKISPVFELSANENGELDLVDKSRKWRIPERVTFVLWNGDEGTHVLETEDEVVVLAEDNLPKWQYHRYNILKKFDKKT